MVHIATWSSNQLRTRWWRKKPKPTNFIKIYSISSYCVWHRFGRKKLHRDASHTIRLRPNPISYLFVQIMRFGRMCMALGWKDEEKQVIFIDLESGKMREFFPCQAFLEDSLFRFIYCVEMLFWVKPFCNFYMFSGLCEKEDERERCVRFCTTVVLAMFSQGLFCASANGFWFNFILCTGRSPGARRKLT